MNQDQIVSLVERAGVAAQPGTRQQQWHQVRFTGLVSGHSLNLGYSLPKDAFIADFVFKTGTRDINLENCQAFCRRFGGEIRSKATVFARLEIPFHDEVRLLNIIKDYWTLPLIAGQAGMASVLSISQLCRVTRPVPTISL
jgi:hypothetical protein